MDTHAKGSLSSGQTPSSPASIAENSHILVVVEDAALNRTLRDLLAGQGYQVLAAHSGAQALRMVHEELLPDLIIADLATPAIDGLTLLENIRRDPSIRRVSVIFLSHYASEEDRRRAKALGVDEYLTKPLDNQELLYSVHGVLARQLAVKLDIEQQVETIRNEILALIQHEFRTPLTLIMGYAEFLQETLSQDSISEDVRHSMRAIVEGGERLHHLIESFLLTATLNRTALPKDEIYPLDPSALWRESMTMLRNEIETGRLQVELNDPPDPIVVYGVLDLLRKALVHLLDNAIRYRRPESTVIRLSTAVRPGYVGWVIQDQGRGLSQRQLDELTKPFVRGHKIGSGFHGIGLGLTLVQRVAELHGGMLSVESKQDEGSTFTLWVADRDR